MTVVFNSRATISGGSLVATIASAVAQSSARCADQAEMSHGPARWPMRKG